MHPNALMKALDGGLKEQNPETYKRLRRAGRLEAELERASGLYQETMETGLDDLFNRSLKVPSTDRVSLIMQGQSDLEREALQLALESLTEITGSSLES